MTPGGPLAGVLLALALPAAAQPGPGGEKPYGILLMGDGSSDEWRKTEAEALKELGKSVPVSFAPGLADPRELQKAVDALEAKRVRKIVAVPLFVTSSSEVLDQTRYLLGIREKPSKDFLESDDPRLPPSRQGRLKLKVPVVMTRALDDHPLVVEILAERAAKASRGRDPASSILVLAGEGPFSEAANKDWLGQAQALAEKVARAAGFPAARALTLREPQRQTERERRQSGLRKRIQDLREHGTVVLVPLELSRSPALMRLPRLLEGLPVRYEAATILPDERIIRFIRESAEAGARLPDMRLFKEERGGPPRLSPPPRLSIAPPVDTTPKIDTRPNLGGNP